MDTEWLLIFEKTIWFGFAAIGFGILFNVPTRTLLPIYLLAAVGGLTKVILVHFGAGVIIASLAGASLIGILSTVTAHNKHAPPLVFSIPAVIPMVPGIFAYKMMLGFIKLTGNTSASDYSQILFDTVNNGLKALFILMTLAVGVSIPFLLTRKASAKELKIKKGNKTT
jgi:uncharacterized membrane protein YjjB (DUF3815 family)